MDCFLEGLFWSWSDHVYLTKTVVAGNNISYKGKMVGLKWGFISVPRLFCHNVITVMISKAYTVSHMVEIENYSAR